MKKASPYLYYVLVALAFVIILYVWYNMSTIYAPASVSIVPSQWETTAPAWTMQVQTQSDDVSLQAWQLKSELP